VFLLLEFCLLYALIGPAIATQLIQFKCIKIYRLSLLRASERGIKEGVRGVKGARG